MCGKNSEHFNVNSLMAEFIFKNIQKFKSYLTGNTLRLRYKVEPVDAV
jgi:hypothetical protein